MLESAKASARYSAETRVFRMNPLAWLKSGYARRDWRESDGLPKVVEEEVARQVAAILGLSDSGLSHVKAADTVQAVEDANEDAN